MSRTGATAFLVVAVAATLVAQAEASTRYTLRGVIRTPMGSRPADFLASTRILLDGGDHVAFPSSDGSFVFTGLLSASYILEVTNPNYSFAKLRVDVSKKFPNSVRAVKADFIGAATVVHVPYSREVGLVMEPIGATRYFEEHPPWSPLDLLKNPMLLMTVLPMVMMFFLPKMMETVEEEQKRQAAEAAETDKKEKKAEKKEKDKEREAAEKLAESLDIYDKLATLTSGVERKKKK